MGTVLGIDVGNSNISFGVFAGGCLVQNWRMATIKERTADELTLFIQGFFRDRDVNPGSLEGVIISSVVPPVTGEVERMCRLGLGLSPIIVGPGIRTGLPIKFENPREVGADLIVNSVAAISRYGPPIIVVDCGTATTFSVIDTTGSYIGGVIGPGLMIAAEALYQRTAKLPRIELTEPQTVLGRNTVASMQSGLIYGTVGQVDGIVERLRGELGIPFKVIATGGWAHLIAKESKTIHEVDPYLTLEGLRILWERNRER